MKRPPLGRPFLRELGYLLFLLNLLGFSLHSIRFFCQDTRMCSARHGQRALWIERMFRAGALERNLPERGFSWQKTTSLI